MSKRSRTNVIVCRNIAELSRHAEAWNDLALSSRRSVPTVSFAWAASYLEHRLKPDETWCCLIAYNENSIVGVLPVVSSPRKHLGYTYRVLRAPFDSHCFATDLLVDPDNAEYIKPLLLSVLFDEFPDHLFLELSRTPDSTFLARQTIGSSYFRLIREHYSYGAYITITTDFLTFRNALSRNFRNNLNKARNKLKEFPSVKFHFLSGEQAKPEGFDIFIKVEAASWKGRRNTAISCSPALLAYYRALTLRLYEARMLEWHFLELDGQYVAANMAVRMKDSIVIWKLAYDEKYAFLSAGSLLLEQLISSLSNNNNVQVIEFLTDYSWYRNWNAQYQCFDQIRIVNCKRRTARVFFFMFIIRRFLKKLFKKSKVHHP